MAINAHIIDTSSRDPLKPLTLQEFFIERQKIWWKRNHGFAPDEWTDDPILKERRFTNIQRELDRGTIVLQRLLETTLDPVLRAHLCMRFVALRGAYWTLELAGLDPDPDWLFINRELRERGLPFQGRAGQGRGVRDPRSTNPSSAALGVAETGLTAEEFTALNPKPNDLYALNLQRTEEEWFHNELPQRLAEVCITAGDSMKPVYEWALGRRGVSRDFGAMQVALNCRYAFPNLSDDVWVYFLEHDSCGKGMARGSGAGMEWVTQLLPQNRRPDTYLELAKMIRDEQKIHFPFWAEYSWEGKPNLTLADIEHGACEYSKYRRHLARAKQGRGGMPRYTPYRG